MAYGWLNPDIAGGRILCMKRIECLVGVLSAAGGGAILAHDVNQPVGAVRLSDIVLGLGVAVLGIGLLRDLGHLALHGRFGCNSCRLPKGVQVLCAESVVGVGLVALGLFFLAVDLGRAYALTPGSLAIYLGSAFVVSGLIKDRVVLIRRIDDHRDIVFQAGR